VGPTRIVGDYNCTTAPLTTRRCSFRSSLAALHVGLLQRDGHRRSRSSEGVCRVAKQTAQVEGEHNSDT
jgi:hypothetical protein